MDIMVDCETLDTAPSAVILSIGVVLFDPKSDVLGDYITIKPDIDEQIKLGRTTSEDTLAWWEKQTTEAKEEAFGDSDRFPFHDCMKALHTFCWNKSAVWSHGAAFDVVLLEDAFRMANMHAPWHFANVRDTRTLFALTKVSLKNDGYVTTHKAEEDALRQAVCVQKAYQILKNAGVV